MGRIVIVLVALFLLAASLTDYPRFADGQDRVEKKADEKKADDKADKAEKPAKPEKPKPKTLDDVVTRATSWARKFGRDHKGLARVTAFPSNGTEDENLTVFIEFGNGNLALYQGNADPDLDNYIVLEKSDLPGLKEAMERAQAR